MLLDHGDAIGKGTSPDWPTRLKKKNESVQSASRYAKKQGKSRGTLEGIAQESIPLVGLHL